MYNYWRCFVQEQGNRDPQGVVYRILVHKKNKDVLLSALSIQDGDAIDKNRFLNLLLNDLLPDDTEAGETHIIGVFIGKL